ncbi:class I SAM-dependent methyltransferase [Paraburkholderia sabiae]|uniref:Class I SAM-dependent methyltransferase n=1 Tax=Paraburkholderia sabiae TaxID=273251 RepID=A0ABU9QL04_9BURK|nr:class I SAM-dependent methyltransferase [Paraburkholderia sabiae]WJZ73487.1 class I SAM-dependent methyltransferase [Paraburkholderia sabiae]CAD6542176.1 Trans-aconitate 2-methyltransferase [Paraburkholderia sabiae]
MAKSEFDKFAQDYDRVLGESIPDGLNEDGYFAEYKIALMAKRLKDRQPRRILDFGCGAGRSLPHLAQYFPDAELWGFDVSQDSLNFAHERTPSAHLFSDWSIAEYVSFDAIVAANVFHHIPPDQRPLALDRCNRALAPNGIMFLFEHNPLNPATRWIFERCPFDVDAEMLSLRTALDLTKAAGFSTEQHGYTLFFPRPLAALRGFEPYLKRLPLGAQYYVQMEK